MVKAQSLEQQITSRFVQAMADVTGPGKQFRYYREFGRKAGLISQEIHKLETGAMSVQLRHIVAINKITGVSFTWLLTGKGEMYAGKQQVKLTDLEKRIIEIERKYRKR